LRNTVRLDLVERLGTCRQPPTMTPSSIWNTLLPFATRLCRPEGGLRITGNHVTGIDAAAALSFPGFHPISSVHPRAQDRHGVPPWILPLLFVSCFFPRFQPLILSKARAIS